MCTNLVRQVCWALGYLHNMQLIHRDVKPSNIFLLSNRRSVRLGDFGISKILDSFPEKEQLSGHATEGRVGTKRYMAPEVLFSKTISCQADIWSVGCVVFELATLQHPTYEQTGRFFFEWIPSVYSRNFVETISSCLCEAFDARPSPRELMDRLIAPYRESALVRQIFHDACTWQQQQLDMQVLAFQDQMAGLGEYLPSGSVSVDSHAPPFEEKREKGPLLNGSDCGHQSTFKMLHRDLRMSSTDRPKSDLGSNIIASRAADSTNEFLEKLSSNQGLSSPEPCPGCIKAAYSGHGNEQACIAESRKQGPSVNGTAILAAEGYSTATTLQQLDALQQRYEEQCSHSSATREKQSLGHIQEIRTCGGTDLARQPGPGLDPLDEARPSSHVVPGRTCQNTMWDDSPAIFELRACHLGLPMETILVAGRLNNASASIRQDTFSDFRCFDHTPVIAPLASAADVADGIMSERLKLCPHGEEATEQVCSDYDIMCHQVDARHSGGCPSESLSCFISHDAAAKGPSQARDDPNDLSVMMSSTQLDLGTALPSGQSLRLSTCDTDCCGSRCENSAMQHQYGTEIKNPHSKQGIQIALQDGNTNYKCYTSSYTDLCLQSLSMGNHSVLTTENKSTSTSCGHPDARKVIEDLHRIRFGIRATLAENKFCIDDTNLKLPGL
jgi:serine/threonine protein kinase